MSFKLWTLGLAFAGVAFLACSNSESAGTSVETENSIAVLVKSSDGSPLACSKIRVRPEDYLSRPISGETEVPMDSVLGVWNAETDSLGAVYLPKFQNGSYMMEAVADTLKGVAGFTIEKSDDEISIDISVGPTGSISGVVRGMAPSTFFGALYAGVRGMEYSVKVSDDGSFKLTALPATEMSVDVYGLAKNGNEASIMYLASQKVVVEASKSTSVEFGKAAAPAVKPDPVPAEDPAEDPEPVEVYPHYLLDDFEDGVWGWYRAASRYSTGKISAEEAGLGRAGSVVHFEYSNDSAYNWTLMGRSLGGMYDFSDLDSVSFWARGDGSLFLSFDKYVDSTNRGKSWVEVELAAEWARYVLTPADLNPADKNGSGGNIGWEAVKDTITNINFFGNFGTEFWLDDVEIFGVKSLVE